LVFGTKRTTSDDRTQTTSDDRTQTSPVGLAVHVRRRGTAQRITTTNVDDIIIGVSSKSEARSVVNDLNESKAIAPGGTAYTAVAVVILP
jgi:hypothetical protein